MDTASVSKNLPETLHHVHHGPVKPPRDTDGIDQGPSEDAIVGIDSAFGIEAQREGRVGLKRNANW
jgi:hypothetical protein